MPGMPARLRRRRFCTSLIVPRLTRSERGFSCTNMEPRLSVGLNEVCCTLELTYSTSGSARTRSETMRWRSSMAWKEMSGAASVRTMMMLVSSVGRKPFLTRPKA